jgi:predicted transcriptional regulator
LGFEEVSDYSDGKLDWMAAGLPTEGEEANVRDAGQMARTDVPTCGLNEKLGDVRARVRSSGWDLCVVVNEERIVLGQLREQELAKDPSLRAEEAMTPGPGTYRPYISIGEIAHILVHHDLPGTLITTSDGRLIGALSRKGAVERFRRTHDDDSIAS